MQHLVPGWKSLNNCSFAINRRIWVIWDDNKLELALIKDLSQLIHCHVIKRVFGMECLATVVNDFNTLEQRQSLCEDLILLAQGINLPWFTGGEFNPMIIVQDKIYGNTFCTTKVKDFVVCVNQVALTKLPWRGDYYTWSNKHDQQ